MGAVAVRRIGGMLAQAQEGIAAFGGDVDNERPICAVPQQARYTGPVGGANAPSNWTASNFRCR